MKMAMLGFLFNVHITTSLRCFHHHHSIHGQFSIRRLHSSRSATKWGDGMTQEDFMNKDCCIRVDEFDNILGTCSKKEAHLFTSGNPKGYLHRAFSVFLFDSSGRLLLQRRALHKPTFPGVWTNTCCSHPLSGTEPSEVDDIEAVQSGSIPGVRTAAIRKLNQELGIPVDSIHPSQFRAITRILYCAADSSDTPPSGDDELKTSETDHELSDWQWGEHELDYILLVQSDALCTPNPEEVCDTKYVTLSELQHMLDPSAADPPYKWSPWFRIIVDKFLIDWWRDLPRTLNTNDFVDWQTIHSFR